MFLVFFCVGKKKLDERWKKECHVKAFFREVARRADDETLWVLNS